jgi:hypothetical protein
VISYASSSTTPSESGVMTTVGDGTFTVGVDSPVVVVVVVVVVVKVVGMAVVVG